MQMFELLNWHDTGILWHYNWVWLLLAFALGVWIGYSTCEPVKASGK